MNKEIMAFPLNNGIPNGQDGMTLCDWFAGQALVGYLSEPAVLINKEKNPKIAKVCYELANAMLKARNNQTGKEI